MPADPRPLRTVYLAGELFNAKHLAGNALLAGLLADISASAPDGPCLECILPQDLPQAGATPHQIRDQDLLSLIACDAAIFHYDGLELDSGTVVEYLFAKFADIPSVLVRTDFRHAGDQKGGDPWNLMNSFYPRTATVWINSMEIYHAHLRSGLSSIDAAHAITRDIAARIFTALTQVLLLPPILPPELSPSVYQWLALMPAFQNQAAAIADVARIHSAKVAKGLL